MTSEAGGEDALAVLRASTRARVALGRAGDALPTARLLELRAAHAAARDAVHEPLDADALTARIAGDLGVDTLRAASAAPSRAEYLRRPDLGRRLADGADLAQHLPDPTGRTARAEPSSGGTAREQLPSDGPGPEETGPPLAHVAGRAAREELSSSGTVREELSSGDTGAGPGGEAVSRYDVVLVVADGLSPLAVSTHAVPLLREILDRLDGWRVAPVVVATQARVALGDEIATAVGARSVVVLVGERPGMSSTDSLGIYFTFDARRGRRDSERNCISNVRPPHGTGYAAAATTLAMLMAEARRLGLSGVQLKADPALPA